MLRAPLLLIPLLVSTPSQAYVGEKEFTAWRYCFIRAVVVDHRGIDDAFMACAEDETNYVLMIQAHHDDATSEHLHTLARRTLKESVQGHP